MPSSAEIDAAAEALKQIMINLYGIPHDYDDRCQLARAALKAAEAIRKEIENDHTT